MFFAPSRNTRLRNLATLEEDGIHADFGIPNNVLGFTVAAAGTSFPNVFSGICVARQGKAAQRGGGVVSEVAVLGDCARVAGGLGARLFGSLWGGLQGGVGDGREAHLIQTRRRCRPEICGVLATGTAILPTKKSRTRGFRAGILRGQAGMAVANALGANVQNVN